MKYYELRKDFETPIKTIRKGTIKSEEDWITEIPGLKQGDCDQKIDWFCRASTYEEPEFIFDSMTIWNRKKIPSDLDFPHRCLREEIYLSLIFQTTKDTSHLSEEIIFNHLTDKIEIKSNDEDHEINKILQFGKFCFERAGSTRGDIGILRDYKDFCNENKEPNI